MPLPRRLAIEGPVLARRAGARPLRWRLAPVRPEPPAWVRARVDRVAEERDEEDRVAAERVAVDREAEAFAPVEPLRAGLPDARVPAPRAVDCVRVERA